jgi:type VI secretion system protein ImpB
LAKSSGQKFIARNRAPRVQIEYDVEVYGAEKTVQLPFVMGVMADLSGKPAEKLEPVADRKFLEIDVDNFDSRLKSMKPRVAFPVANTLTGEGNLSVDITFESMDDFSPAAIARKVEPLRKLLETRTQLANLMTYMDGKSGAEEMISGLLQDSAKLQSLVSAPNPQQKSTAPAAKVAAAAPVVAPQPVPPQDDLDSLLDDSTSDAKASSDDSGDDDLDSLLNGL